MKRLLLIIVLALTLPSPLLAANIASTLSVEGKVDKGEAVLTLNDRLKVFYEETDYEMQCDKICGQSFETLDEHSEFIKNGGCKKLIGVLSSPLA